MKPKCYNYYKRNGQKRSLEHRVYDDNAIAVAVVTSRTMQPWYLFLEDEEAKNR